MRGKSILALAVALAMIFSVIPAFGLTASAAEAGDTVKVGGVKYALVDGKNYATNGSFDENWNGWTHNNGGKDLNNANEKVGKAGYSLVEDDTGGNYLKIDGNCGQSYYYSPDASGGEDRRVLVPTTYWEGAKADKKYYMAFDMMVHKRQPDKANFVYYGVYEQNSFTLSTYGTDFSKRQDAAGTGNIAAGKTFATEDDKWFTVSTVVDVSKDGYFGFQWAWIQDYDYVCIDNFEIYEVNVVPSDASATIKYMDGETEVATGETVEGLYEGDEFTPIVNEGAYYASEEQGFLYTIGTPEPIVLKKGAENVAEVPLKKERKIVGTNKVENGDFEGDTAAPDNFKIVEGTDYGREGKVLQGPDGGYSNRLVSGIGGTNSYQETVDVTVGTSYFYTIDVYQNGGNGLFMNYAFTDKALKCVAENDDTMNGTVYITDGTKSSISAATATSVKETGNGKFAADKTNQWATFDGIVTAPAGANLFEFDVYYFCDSNANGGSLIDDVEFYELGLLDTQKVATVKQTLNGETLAEKSGVIIEGEELSLPEATFYKDGVIYNVDEAKATFENNDVTVEAAADETKSAVKFDAFFSFNDGGAYEPWGTTKADGNMVQITGKATVGDDSKHVLAALMAKDADGNSTIGESVDAGQTRPGMFKFDIPKDYADGKLVTLHLYMAQNHTQTRGARLAIVPSTVDISTITEDGGNSAKSVEDLTPAADAPVSFSDEINTATPSGNNYTNETGWITVDITEAVKYAKAKEQSDITLLAIMPSGLIKAAQLEDAGFGQTYAGMASYLTVEDGLKVTVSGASDGALITKNGSKVNGTTFYALEGDTVRVYNGTTNDTGVADVIVNNAFEQEVTITGATDITVITKENLGIGLLDGAQIRYGMGVDEEGKVKIDVEGSGLRFIGKVNKTETAAGIEGATFGVEIKPQDSEDLNNVVDVTIDKWQDEAEGIFSVALTNLKVSNYNRVFVATPYVKIGETKVYGDPVSRSVYEVAFGLLKSGTEDAQTGTLPYEVTEEMKGVLNAYVNQVGIRLKLTKADGEFKADSDSYVGGKTEKPGAFFTVTSDATKKDEGVYVVTITPESGVTLNNSADFIKEYIRINNNNSVVRSHIEVSEGDNGSVVITFTYTE